MLIKPLKTIIFTIILGMVYIMPTVARAACAENEIDVLGDGTQCETAKFTVTTTEIADGGKFQFYMSAKGTFYVDWGDGNIQTISRTNTANTIYSHSYTDSGTYDIRFGGIAATGNAYPVSMANTAVISFSVTPKLLARITGSLGALFPTRGTANGEQPMFRNTFYGCSGLTGSIPENLFAGISGAPVRNMFRGTFSGCSGLTGSIPENLFAGISGAPAEYMFASTFAGCSGLTGSIPENLFAGISGAPAESMFASTFERCSELTGSIPAGLFSGISGAPADSMFYGTFYQCSGLTGSIPGNLFSGISGAPADNMFRITFTGCSGLTGSIPGNLFSGISGAPADNMFFRTFADCSSLSGFVSPTLFSGITSGTTSNAAMYGIFSGTNLTTSCPPCHTQYITGFEEYWDGKVSCEVSLGENEHIYNDVCYQDCAAGITKIKTSTGLEFPLFDTKPTTPALHIKHNGTICYTPMELGDGGANSMNFMSGGETYHLGTLE